MKTPTIIHNRFNSPGTIFTGKSVRLFIFMLFLFYAAFASAQQLGNILFRPVLGEERVLYILVNYPDDNMAIMTEDQAIIHADNAAAIAEANSYGLHTFDNDVTPVLTMPQPKTFYELDSRLWFVRIRADALAIAKEAGFAVDEYDREVIFSKKLWPQPYKGAGGINFRTVISKENNASLTSHEFGHTYDWTHANFWRVSSSNPLDSSGIMDNYGDKFDIMGDAFNPHHYNPWSKWRAGWLPTQSIKTVTESGTYVIRAIELDPMTAPVNTYTALRIRRSPDMELIVYYRSQEPFANSGALISLVSPTNKSPTVLLDMTPGSQIPSQDYRDAALVPGATMNDPDTGIEITLLEKFDDSLVVNVVVPPGPMDVLPYINFTSPEAGVTIKGGVDYAITAYDPDIGNENGAGIEKVKFTLGWIKGDNPYIDDGTEFFIVDSTQVLTPPYVFHVETEGLPDECYQLKALAISQNGGKNIAVFKHIIDNTGPSVITAVTEVDATANPIQLEQNKPNPFYNSTTINYYLNRPGEVTLNVFNLLGRKVQTLVQGHQAVGRYVVHWNGNDSDGGYVNSGLYVYEIRTGKSIVAKKMLLMR